MKSLLVEAFGPYTHGKIKAGATAEESAKNLEELIAVGTELAQDEPAGSSQASANLDEIMSVFDDMFIVVGELKNQISGR